MADQSTFAQSHFFRKVVLFIETILCRAFPLDSGRMRLRVIDLSRDFILSSLSLFTLRIPSSEGPRSVLFVFPRYVISKTRGEKREKKIRGKEENRIQKNGKWTNKQDEIKGNKREACFFFRMSKKKDYRV